MTAPALMPALLDCGNEDGDALVFALGCVLGGFVVDIGVKEVVQIYSSLLLISSNIISFSVPCVYPEPISFNMY